MSILLPDHLQPIDEAMRREGAPPESFASVLAGVTEDHGTQTVVEALKTRMGAKQDEVERVLLATAARQAIPHIDSQRVHQAVKDLLRKDLDILVGGKSTVPLGVGSYGFVRASRIVTFRRFPAGPMDWEFSGLPRSWIGQVGLANAPRLLYFVAAKLGGFKPMFFMHVAPQPRARALVIEKEVLRSYYRIARSLELQPEMKGLIASAWFHDPRAVADNPHLEWLNRPYLQHGGIIMTMGPAAADSGFAERNPERKAQFEAGELQYKVGVAIWPRREMLQWADNHPQYG